LFWIRIETVLFVLRKNEFFSIIILVTSFFSARCRDN
jgi:hypothetical protein